MPKHKNVASQNSGKYYKNTHPKSQHGCSSGLMHQFNSDLFTTDEYDQDFQPDDYVNTLRMEENDFYCPVCSYPLLDPITVTCGHNVCQACLAGWYMSTLSRRRECPLCRQFWVGCPQINYALKNIIARDSRFHSILSKRRDELSADVTYDHNVRTFTTELSRRNKNIYGLEHEHASFFSGVAFSLFVFTIVYIFMCTKENTGYSEASIRKPVNNWAVSDVGNWINSLDWAKDYYMRCMELEVDGAALLSIPVDALMDDLKIVEESHRTFFKLTLNNLLAELTMVPNSAWNYKITLPRKKLYFSYAMTKLPRTTILFLYLFDYENSFLPFMNTTLSCIFDQDTLSQFYMQRHLTLLQFLSYWTCILAFPYGMIGLFAWSQRAVYGIMHLFVISTCFFQTMFEVNYLRNVARHMEIDALDAGLQHYMKSLMSAFVSVCLWSIVPSALNSLRFYVWVFCCPVYLCGQFINLVFQQ